MLSREEMIDLLRSLSIIDGAAMATSDQSAGRVITDELEWCTELLLNKLKEIKCS